ncbi:hypothetical protein [Limibacillus halophilus]|uniref:Uncharacterized protein n=1 Tax=Limibacillus halophilus TaxID=1579333 RepID=A0A839ST46_9PROT|nr:hypothetical protein [Limibacillus halophilus]MBB3064526.1 hypothetical protein [Limibacillus halophilus]
MIEKNRRPAFRFINNVGLQYHFFAAGRMFSVRLACRAPKLSVMAGWIYDGGVREICKSDKPWTQSDSPYLDINGDVIDIRDENGEIVVEARAANGEDGFIARGKPIHSLSWMDTFSENNDEVLHLPDITGTVEFRGTTYPAKGYCKHVEWTYAPRYTGYRFLHGLIDNGEIAVWSADAVFAYKKYDYFKMVEKDGSITVADEERSSHKQNTVYAKIGERDVRVEFEELGMWELPLIGDGSDMVIMQRYGNITFIENGVKKTGVAMTEYGFGRYTDGPISA